MMCRLHMQYLGSRVAENTIEPSGSHSGSMSLTPLARVSCLRPVPSAFTVQMW